MSDSGPLKANGALFGICRRPIVGLAFAALLAGCNPGPSGSATTEEGPPTQPTQPTPPTQPPAQTGTPFLGSVHGAQQPVSGALLQLYAAGAEGDGSSATRLISVTLTTSDGTGAMNSNANAGNINNSLPAGSFTIPSVYTCPLPTSPVYLVASSGNPALAAGTNNQQIALMATLGPCGSIASGTPVAINELTTIGSIAPVLSFMNSATAMGSGTSDSSQFVAAVAQVSEYTNLANGTAPGPALPIGYNGSAQVIRTIGDILAPCIHSSGGVAGDSTPCGQLFKLATLPAGEAPHDTIQAVLNILKNPSANASSIYALLAPAGPFQPSLPVAPKSWSVAITPFPTTFSTNLNGTTEFIGASIINYWPLPLHKNGIFGQTSAQVLARFSSDVLNHGYARVVILCGTNDVLNGVPNLAAELPANLEAMAEIATNAGIEVVLSELPPLTSGYANLDPQISVANAAIVQLATKHGYLLVDFNTPLKGHPEDSIDGIHPNSAGYSLMEQALSSVVLY